MSALKSRSRIAWMFVGIFALAFAIRLYRLDAVPLRGDEGFAVRYWAADPFTATRDLARQEPHPVLTFYAFYAWKQIAGGSVFAMRYLPLLGSLIGVAAVAGLARQLFGDRRVAVLAAILWAVHPFVIWHAQDVRNYALWSGLSPLAMLCFIRAAQSGRWSHWGIYLAAATAALYSFFFEVFLLPVQGLALVLLRKNRKGAERALLAWSMLLLLLIPWFIQAWYLSRTGYVGATEDASLGRLLTWLLPTLIAGAVPEAPWDALLVLGWLAVASCGLLPAAYDRRLLAWLSAWIAVPMLLLYVAATRASVFHPRYLIAVTPVFAIISARVLVPGPRSPRTLWGQRLRMVSLLAVLVPLYGVTTLPGYYRGVNAKAPDWPALATYLEERAGPRDLVVQNLPDPAFGYYYRGPADETSLLPDIDVAARLRPEINFYSAIWLIGDSPAAERFLEEQLQLISGHTIEQFAVKQYRPWIARVSEIAVPSGALFREREGEAVARLAGYTILGPDAASSALTVMLYWEPLRQTAIDYTVFVHLLGETNPATGGPLWDQDDHPPLNGTAPTSAWEIGITYRDSYNLLDKALPSVPPGTYSLEIGFYVPSSGERLLVEAPDGSPLGDSLTLEILRFPAN